MPTEVLLVLLPWSAPDSFIRNLSKTSPGIRVIQHTCTDSDTELPKDIKDSDLADVTVWLGWRIFPTRDQAPKLRYVQLVSAGCNQILGLPLFEDTDIPFCTANGVHP